MRELIDFLRMMRWPAIFAGLMLITHDACSSSLIVLALVFRQDLSAVMRRRRFTLEGPGFRGSVDGGAGGPPTDRHDAA